jgi:hypothetical protein
MYNEIMISVLYRLTQLSFEIDPVQEAIRLGLLAVSTTLFMQRQFMKNSYDNLVGIYCNALLKLREYGDVVILPSIVLWLRMVLDVVDGAEDCRGDWLNTWFDEIISRASIQTWSQAHEMLRTMVWVGFVHDRRGKQAFDMAMSRIGKID